jgi:hypothetical protein
MGNAWTYELVTSLDLDEVVRRTIENARVHGLEAFDDHGDALVYAADEEAPRSMCGLGPVVDLLRSRGGVLLRSRGGVLALRRDGEWYVDAVFEPPRRMASVGVNHDLRPERAHDRLVFRSLEALFRQNLATLDPAYGYATDEWSLEETWGAGCITHWEQLSSELQDGRVPPFLTIRAEAPNDSMTVEIFR